MIFWDLGGQEDLQNLWDKVKSQPILGWSSPEVVCLLFVVVYPVLLRMPWGHICSGLL